VDEQALSLLVTAAATLVTRHPHAAPTLSTALQEVLRQQQVVDLATGILMQRHRLDPPAARGLLADTAASTGQGLGELAQALLGSTSTTTHP
jgi:AmiR/NasT family two-component response regulator